MKLHPANSTPGNTNTPTPAPVTNQEIVEAMAAIMVAISRLGNGPNNPSTQAAWDKVNDLRNRIK